MAAAIRFRALVMAAAFSLAVVGVAQIPTTAVETLPEFAPPTVEVQTEALGLSSAEVEQLITVPLEADLLNGVAFLDEIRSESIAGLSSIELVFDEGTNVMEARQVVAERLTQAHALPNVSRPPAMLQPLSSTSRVMMIGLSSDTLSGIEMSVLARWKIRPYLMGVSGVANVSIWGQREQQLQVQVDPDRLRRNGVTLDQIVETTGNALWVSPLSFVEASTPGTGGFIETPNQRLTVQHISPITDAASLASVTVEGTDGRILRLGDVATVVEDHQPLIGDAVDSGASSLMLVIERFPDVGVLEVSDGVERAMDDLAPALPDMVIDTSVYQPAGYVDAGLDNIGLALLIGLLLLTALVGLVLRSALAALLMLISVSASVLTALLVLKAFDVTANTMILAGLVIALAVVVDDAITDVSALRRDGPGVVAALARARRPLLVVSVLMLVAAVPLWWIPGLAREFAQPLVVAYALAIGASLLVSLTLTPVLAAVGLRPHNVREWRQLAAVRSRYRSALTGFSRNPTIVYGACLIGGALAVSAIPLAGERAILPTIREQTLIIQWDGPPGTSSQEMQRIAARASAEVAELSGVEDVGGQVGRAITSDQVVGVDSSELWVSIDDGADYEQTVAAIDAVLDGYPGVFHESRTYPEEQLREVRTGVSDDLVVRVYGQDLETLETEAERLRASLDEVEGVVDPRVEYDPVEPTIAVEVDLAAAEQHRIKPGDVRRASAVLLSGLEVGSLFESQKVFEVVVWGVPEIRHSLTSVEDLMIDRPDGGQVRLGDVADVRIAAAPNVIKRESVSRRIDVVAQLDGRSLDDVRSDVEAAIDAAEFPVEYHAVVVDPDETSASSERDMAVLAFAALLVVFLVLQVLFGSWRLAGLVTLTLPIALAGSALAAVSLDGPLTLAAGAAALAVLGFAVRHAVGALSDAQAGVRGGAQPSDAVADAAGERLVPLLTSAVGIALLLAPALIMGDRPGLEIARDVAAVMLCGLVSAVLYALFLVPALSLQLAPALRADREDDDDFGERR